MLEDRIVYMNGDFVRWDQATVHVMSHGFARGSAIFEVMSLHASKLGPAVFRLADHIQRLFKSAGYLHMELPLSPEQFYAAVNETVKKNDLNQGFIKIVCYFPQLAVEILPPQKVLDVCIFALDPARDVKRLDFSTDKGVTACLSRWRKLDPQTVPVQAKASANYLNGMIARLDACERGFDYAVMLDTQGFVAEGATEAFFLVKDAELMTSATGTVLESITRKSVLQAAQTLGMRTFEGRLEAGLLTEADEMFFSSSPMKVNPVGRIDDRVLVPVPGPITKRMSDLFHAICSGEDERFAEWLHPVK